MKRFNQFKLKKELIVLFAVGVILLLLLDYATSDCTVYADWNNTKPFQTATATGPGGVDDYSTWNFTYTPQYHIITNGTNELTAKLSCISNPANVTKWNS